MSLFLTQDASKELHQCGEIGSTMSCIPNIHTSSFANPQLIYTPSSFVKSPPICSTPSIQIQMDDDPDDDVRIQSYQAEEGASGYSQAPCHSRARSQSVDAHKDFGVLGSMMAGQDPVYRSGIQRPRVDSDPESSSHTFFPYPRRSIV